MPSMYVFVLLLLARLLKKKFCSSGRRPAPIQVGRNMHDELTFLFFISQNILILVRENLTNIQSLKLCIRASP